MPGACWGCAPVTFPANSSQVSGTHAGLIVGQDLCSGAGCHAYLGCWLAGEEKWFDVESDGLGGNLSPTTCINYCAIRNATVWRILFGPGHSFLSFHFSAVLRLLRAVLRGSGAGFQGLGRKTGGCRQMGGEMAEEQRD